MALLTKSGDVTNVQNFFELSPLWLVEVLLPPVMVVMLVLVPPVVVV